MARASPSPATRALTRTPRSTTSRPLSPLGVLGHQVGDRAVDRWESVERGVAALSVVVLKPWRKRCCPVGVGEEDLAVGPFNLQGPVESFDFASCAGRSGESPPGPARSPRHIGVICRCPDLAGMARSSSELPALMSRLRRCTLARRLSRVSPRPTGPAMTCCGYEVSGTPPAGGSLR